MLVSSRRNAHWRWISGLGTPECSFCLNGTLNYAFMLKTSIMRREPFRALEKPPGALWNLRVPIVPIPYLPINACLVSTKQAFVPSKRLPAR